MRTVKDLKLTPEQAEQAAFLLNYRGTGFDKDAIFWGSNSNQHEFTEAELLAALEADEKLTAADPVRLQKTEYALRVQAELHTILKITDEVYNAICRAFVGIYGTFLVGSKVYDVKEMNFQRAEVCAKYGLTVDEFENEFDRRKYGLTVDEFENEFDRRTEGDY